MKKLLRICLFFSIISVPKISQSITAIPPSEDEIVLEGSLDNSSTRSVLPDPISATIGLKSLNLNFRYNVGNINVEIYNSSGEMVYENNINTQIQGALTIDVSEWDIDFYEIRFVSTTGNYMFGSYEID
nr:DUF3244 domain-containing protein [uncultured Draconibacterium sp.]